MTQPSLFTPLPTATFSTCTLHPSCAEECAGRLYRYTLEWPASETGSGTALFVLANPSTATHLKPDPTVARCIGYARDWGYARCAIGNVRAYRSTDPKGVPPDPEGIGPENARYLAELITSARVIVCGWGKLGGEAGRATFEQVRALGRVPHALALNEDMSPRHPLYLLKTLTPFPIVGAAEARGEKPGPWLIRTLACCEAQCGRPAAFMALGGSERDAFLRIFPAATDRWYAFESEAEATRVCAVLAVGVIEHRLVYDPGAETVPDWAGGRGKGPHEPF